MDSLGSEVSTEIRRAIVAKLEELKAYVDDELPEYIMVMIANDKSVEQMASDLDLFLHDHSKPFAQWLQGVLDKLQSVTAAKKKKPKTPKEGKKATKKSKDKGSGHGKEKAKKRRREESPSTPPPPPPPPPPSLPPPPTNRVEKGDEVKKRKRHHSPSRSRSRDERHAGSSPKRRPRVGDFYGDHRRSPRRHRRGPSPALKAGKHQDADNDYDPEKMLKKSIAESSLKNGAQEQADHPTRRIKEDRQEALDLDEVHRKRMALTKLKHRGELDAEKLQNINKNSRENRRENQKVIKREGRRENPRANSRKKQPKDLRESSREKRREDSRETRRENERKERDKNKQNHRREEEDKRRSKPENGVKSKIIQVIEEQQAPEKKSLPDLRERLLARRKERKDQGKEKTPPKKDDDELSKMRRQALESMTNRKRGGHHDHGRRKGDGNDDLKRIRTKEAQIEELKKVISKIRGGADDSDDSDSSSDSSSGDSSDDSGDSSTEDDSSGITKIIHSAGKVKDATAGRKGPEFFVTLNGIGNANSYFDKIKDGSEPTIGGLKLKKNQESCTKTVYVKTGKPAPSKVTPVKESEVKKPEVPVTSTLEARREKLMTDKPKAMVAPITKPQRKRVEAPKGGPIKPYFPSTMPLPSKEKPEYVPEVTNTSTCKYWPRCERGSSCKYYHPSSSSAAASSSSGGSCKRICIIYV